MRARTLLPLLVAVAATAPFALVAGATPAAAAGTPPPTPVFSAPLALNDASGASTNGSEPSIAVDSHDKIYVSAPASLPFGGCPFWYVHPDGTSYDYRGTMDTDQGSIGGGDCDISTTPIGGGQFDDVSVTSLSLANLTSNVTTDGGATWKTVANSASQQAFVVDRQWQAGDPGLGRHYLTVHDGTANIQVSVSTDGGYQYVQNTPAIDPTKNRKALSSGVSISVVDGSNHFGALVVDPVTHHLFIPFLAPVEGSTGFNEHTLYISEGDPCPGGTCTTPGGLPMPISWSTYKAFEAPASDNLSNDFPALTIDSNGRLYAAFTGAVTNAADSTAADIYSKSRIFVLHAPTAHTAAGTWSTPQAVDPGTGHSNVFPWLVAGSGGHVAVAWYGSVLSGTRCPGAGSVGDGNPSSVSDNCLNVWHVGYAQSSDADTAAPSWNATDISGTVHKGPICNKGLSCATGTRTMLDFFDIAIDSQGRPNLVYVSDTRSLNTADVQFTRQCGGTSLTGLALPGCTGGGGTTGGTTGATTGSGTTGTTGDPLPTNCVSPQITDPAGDATNTGVVDAHQPATNEPDVDIVNAGLTWDAAKQALVGVLHVSDLSAAPGTNEFLRIGFTVNGTAYNLSASREGTGQTSYGWAKAAAGSLDLSSLTGSFDAAKNAVTIELPAATYAAKQPGLPALGEGSVFTQLSATGQRLVGAHGPDGSPVEGTGGGATPTVDTAAAAASCIYTVAPPAITPEVPYAALLPLVGLGVMGLLYVRRRRRADIA